MLVTEMSEFNNALEQLREAVLRLRPTVRPYIIAGLWLCFLASIAWDVKRHLSDHPRPLTYAITTYSIVIGALVFDYVAERRLRNEKQEQG
jgi:hypothetical protein